MGRDLSAPRPMPRRRNGGPPPVGPPRRLQPVGAAAAPTVDVAPILDKAVAAKGEKLDWRRSIVD